jgi:hypothetical protein
MPVGRLGKFLATSALLALAVSGVATFALRQRAREADPSRPLMEHVRSNGKRGDVWLVPLQFESFRLETGNPIVADTKSHPLRADEVIEWHDRVEAIRSLYGQEGSSLDCAVLEATAARYGANHVAVPADRRAECDALEPVYRDARFAAFAVRTLAPP